ncbi:MAG: tRNA 2-thiocytidine(32) synthetase TtcA, partial [Prevotella sp.]|nr:tRNA 2-thiocytidine(32) synthetase TtcA [Prevotella sp.]
VEEADISSYAEQQDYRRQLKRCPHEHETNRTAIRGLFAQMQALHADARQSVWNALESTGKLVEY